MSLHFTNIEVEVSCCFMHENGNVVTGPAFNEFKPLLTELEFNATTDIKMVHNTDVCLNIDTIDDRNTNKILSRNIKESKKLDVSINDINIGSTDLVFNFTDFNIVTYNKYNIPMMLAPLDNKILRDKYRGKIVFMTIHRLNNPAIVSDMAGINKNYIKDIKEKTRYRKLVNSKFNDFCKVIDFADLAWDDVDYLSQDYKCNTIKVVTIGMLDGDRLINNNVTTSILIMNKDILITRDNLFSYKENPSLNNEVDITAFKDKIIPNSRFLYIIDNDDNIGDRYYNVNGLTERIPKIKNSQHAGNGLYNATFTEDFNIKIEEYVPIEKLDEVKYVYRTREEAEYGANKVELYNQQIKQKEAKLKETEMHYKQMELELQNTIIKNKEEYERLSHEVKKEQDLFKKEQDRLKAEYDDRVRQKEEDYLKLKHKLDRGSGRNKLKQDKESYRMKNEYDNIKYKRDSTLETIKTVAAVAGVIATGFVLYNKLSK